MDEDFVDCVYEVDEPIQSEFPGDYSYEEHINHVYSLAIKLQKYCKSNGLHLFNKADTTNTIINRLS
jgi:hypothetical protein